MKRKRIFIAVMMVAIIALTAGCQMAGPNKTVDNFFKSVQKLEIEEAGEFMSKELANDYLGSLREQGDILDNDEQLTPDEMKEIEGYKEFEDSFKRLANELKYKITDSKVEKDKAEVKVEVIYANASEPLMDSVGELFGQMLGMVFSGKEPTEEDMMELLFETISKKLNDYEIKTNETEGVIHLAKENNKWVITELDENISNALMFGLTSELGNLGEDIFQDLEMDDIEFDLELDLEDMDLEIEPENSDNN